MHLARSLGDALGIGSKDGCDLGFERLGVLDGDGGGGGVGEWHFCFVLVSQLKWLEYILTHLVLRCLPTKLAEWIGENLQDVLGFPDKADQRAKPGSGWTPAELNHIFTAHVLDSVVTTFGCVEWESQLFRGVIITVMRKKYYPFNTKEALPFLQPTVLLYFDTYWYIPVHTLYILVHTSSVLSMYKDVPRMMQLCCSCAGYCTGCSTISLLH